MARTYDPGVPTVATKRPDGTFAVDSFRGEGKSYVVDLTTETCSCPDHQKRGHERMCKHQRAVRAQCWTSYTEKAKLVSDRALPDLIGKYEQAGRLDIALALRAEQLDRQQVAL